MKEINLGKILNAINVRHTGNTDRTTALKAMRKAVELALDMAAEDATTTCTNLYACETEDCDKKQAIVDKHSILAIKARIK